MKDGNTAVDGRRLFCSPLSLNNAIQISALAHSLAPVRSLALFGQKPCKSFPDRIMGGVCVSVGVCVCVCICERLGGLACGAAEHQFGFHVARAHAAHLPTIICRHAPTYILCIYLCHIYNVHSRHKVVPGA